MIGFTESPEQSMLREAVAKVAGDFGHEYYVRKARADERTTELWDALAERGYLSVNLPEAYGGGGMGLSELSIVSEEVAAQGCPLLLILVSPAICGSIIARFGSNEQREHWLPPLAAGRKMVFAITEPDAGSNSHRISTTARRDGAGYRISGTKYYISGVDEAPQMLVVTRTGTNAASGRGELSLFVVDTDAPGLRADPLPVDIVSPEKQYTLFFDDVHVAADRLIGGEGNGLHPLFYGLNPERITGAALGIGIGRYALAKASAYANARTVWDVPIGAHQGIAHPLAKAKIDLELARLMTQKAAWLYDADLDAGEAANMAKYSAAEAAFTCVDRAIQTHGGNGLSQEYGVADLMGMARLLRIAPVSAEMILNHVAHRSLGLPKSY